MSSRRLFLKVAGERGLYKRAPTVQLTRSVDIIVSEIEARPCQRLTLFDREVSGRIQFHWPEALLARLHVSRPHELHPDNFSDRRMSL
jgi:hypothetical protein